MFSLYDHRQVENVLLARITQLTMDPLFYNRCVDRYKNPMSLSENQDNVCLGQVLQELQRQYIRLELALEQHHLRPVQPQSPVRCNSEASDDMSTSADDGSVFRI
jgi:hypothetical protein